VTVKSTVPFRFPRETVWESITRRASRDRQRAAGGAVNTILLLKQPWLANQYNHSSTPFVLNPVDRGAAGVVNHALCCLRVRWGRLRVGTASNAAM
jgi:hypothetical protein